MRAWEQETERLVALRPEAVRQLEHLSDVRSVGVGVRERNAALTGEIVFRVYVSAKRPRSEIPPENLVPETVAGVRTDVVEIPRVRPGCWDKGTRPLVGGIEVASSPFDVMHNEPGTLGCLVTTASGATAVLSNEHVLQSRTNTDKRVWQPHYDTCLGFACNLIGRTTPGLEDHIEHSGTRFYIDCAIAVLDSGIDHENRLRRIPNLKPGTVVDVSNPPGVVGTVRVNSAGKIVAIRDANGNLVDTTRIAGHTGAVPGTMVWKVGAVSGLTAGIVTDALGTVENDRTNQQFDNVVLVRPFAGYQEDGADYFGTAGDSGSVVLDLANRVVALHAGWWRRLAKDGSGAIESGAYCCNIEPVVTHLGVSIKPTPGPTSPTSAIVGGAPVAAHADVGLGERLHAWEARVLATRLGPRLLGLVRTHAAEVHALVTGARRVTIAWHRHHGSAFAAGFARALRDPDGRLPTDVEGVPLGSMLAAMAAALSQHGSAALRADLEAHQTWLLAVFDGCDRLDDALLRLDAGAPGTAL